MTKTLVAGAVALVAAGVANAEITGWFRTNSPSGSAASLASYTSLSNLAGNVNGVSAGNMSAQIPNARYVSVFGDFTSTTPGYVYKSVYNAQGRVAQLVRYSIGNAPAGNQALENFRTNTGGEVFNLQGFGSTAGWDREDDFFADGLGNYYRNGTSSSGNNGVTKYTSFANLVSNTGGVYSAYSTTYSWTDRFWAFEGKFYRTNTNGSNGTVLSYSVYNNFQALLSGTVAQTINGSVPYSASDLFIPVPTPGALSLVGIVGLAAGRRRR
jgi:hypothetical protein